MSPAGACSAPFEFLGLVDFTCALPLYYVEVGRSGEVVSILAWLGTFGDFT